MNAANLKEFRNKSIENLQTEMRTMQHKLQDLRMVGRTQQLKNPREIRELKRSIAQVYTLIKERTKAQ